MARMREPTAEELKAWEEWVATRSTRIRALAQRFDPWSLYRMKSTGQRVTVCAFSEDGTLRVNVTGEHNLVIFDRDVFGVPPDELEPCEPPSAGEPVGALLGPSQITDELEAALRVLVRPDLWQLDESGEAVRKA